MRLSGRHKPIALRSPCCAQALGDLLWSPVQRMRWTPGAAGKNVVFFTLLETHTYQAPARRSGSSPSSPVGQIAGTGSAEMIVAKRLFAGCDKLTWMSREPGRDTRRDA